LVADVAKAALEALRFIVTTGNAIDDRVPYVGFVACRRPARWQPAALRLGNLDRALEFLLTLSTVQVDLVHTVLGGFMWLAGLWRFAMAIPHAVYTFVRAHEGEEVYLWDSVRRELEMMRGILPFLYADLARGSLPVVLAQDAAAEEEKVYGHNRRHFGAYALAASVPPQREIRAVLGNIQTIGRSYVVPERSGSVKAPLGLAPRMPLIQRTTLPSRWFETGGPEWTILLARRWRWNVEIVVGELLALVTWLRILLAVVGQQLLRTEVLMLTDNAAVAALVARGRSARFDLNILLRRLAGAAAVMDMMIRAPWIDTAHQPADEGTRPDDSGRLYTGPVRWKRKNLVIIINACSATFADYFKQLGVHVVSVRLSYFGHGDYDTFKREAKTIFRLLESGRCCSMIWFLHGSEDPNTIENIMIAGQVASRASTYFCILGSHDHDLRAAFKLWDDAEDFGFDTFITHSCRFASSYKISIRVYSSFPHIRHIHRYCVGQRSCSRTGVRHARFRDLTNVDDDNAGSRRLAEAFRALVPHLAQFVGSCSAPGGGVETDSRRIGGTPSCIA